MSRKTMESRTGQNIAEATERAELLIRGLQSRLGDQDPEESTESLELQLQRYFETEAGPGISCQFPLSQIRQRVIEGVAARILSGWECAQDGKGAPLENQVVEKLIDLLFERLVTTRPQLREAAGRTLPGSALPASKGPAKLPPSQLPA